LRIDAFRPLFRDGAWYPPTYALLELKAPSPPGASTWVALERHQHTSYDPNRTTVADAEIRLSFERCDAGRPRHGSVDCADFCGFYNAREQRISLTGRRLESGAVYLPEDLRGLHLGTFAMSEVVRWAKQWPDAVVEPIILSDGDAYPENQERRNRFYEQFGLRFDYEGTLREAGRSKSMRAGDLIDSEAWKGSVVEHPLLDAIADQMRRGADAERNLRVRDSAVKDLAQRLLWADDHPIQFCLRRLWVRHPYTPFMAVILALFVWAIRRSL
jgi:GNAT superfamily N-acetyltransferase